MRLFDGTSLASYSDLWGRGSLPADKLVTAAKVNSDYRHQRAVPDPPYSFQLGEPRGCFGDLSSLQDRSCHCTPDAELSVDFDDVPAHGFELHLCLAVHRRRVEEHRQSLPLKPNG